MKVFYNPLCPNNIFSFKIYLKGLEYSEMDQHVWPPHSNVHSRNIQVDNDNFENEKKQKRVFKKKSEMHYFFLIKNIMK